METKNVFTFFHACGDESNRSCYPMHLLTCELKYKLLQCFENKNDILDINRFTSKIIK